MHLPLSHETLRRQDGSLLGRRRPDIGRRNGVTDEELLRERFGFSSFRPGQREVLRSLAEQGAALAVFPTGGGKSLCYQLPALLLEGVTLVVSPLIALMKDQIDFLRRRGHRGRAAGFVARRSAESREVTRRLRAGALKLLYVAPERFNNERFLDACSSATSIALFAVDEAHCISEWGHNFRPDYLKLAEISRQAGRGAGAGADRHRHARGGAGHLRRVRDSRATARSSPASIARTSRCSPRPSTAADATRCCCERLRARPPGPTIVYVTLQKTAERVAADLCRAGLPARAYHAGMEPEQRDGGAGVVDGLGRAASSSPPSPSAWASTRPTSATSTTTTCPRAWRATARRSAAPGATARPRSSSCSPAPTTCPRWRTSPTATRPRRRRCEGWSTSCSLRGASFDVSIARAVRPARHPPAGAAHRAHLPGAAGGAAPGDAVLRRLRAAPLAGSHRDCRGSSKGSARGSSTSVFAAAKKGRIWYALDPGKVAAGVGAEPRPRRSRAGVPAGAGVGGAAGLGGAPALSPAANGRRSGGAGQLSSPSASRPASGGEIGRLRKVLALVTHDGCQVNALVGYFGERRPEPCGHCTHCLTGRTQQLPEGAPRPALPVGLDVAALAALRGAQPVALGSPRQVARFLCGLGSPGLTRARLTRHPLFGALEDRPFVDVLAWWRGPLTAAGRRCWNAAGFVEKIASKISPLTVSPRLSPSAHREPCRLISVYKNGAAAAVRADGDNETRGLNRT